MAPQVHLTKRASLPSFLGLLWLGIIPNLRNHKRLDRQVGGRCGLGQFYLVLLGAGTDQAYRDLRGSNPRRSPWRLALRQQCRGHPVACDTGRGQSVTPTGKRVCVLGGWHEKFGQPVDAPDPVDRISLRVLAIPDLTVLLGYSQAVGERTQDVGRFDGRQP